MELIQTIRNKARNTNCRIVLPEATEERTLRAADYILNDGLARLILLGDESEIIAKALSWNLSNIRQAVIINPLNHTRKNYFAELLCQIRANKALQMEQALQLVANPLYLASLLIKNGDADGEVAGANNATGDVLRPAFQIIKTKKGFKSVSGAFVMLLKDPHFGENGLMVFADCAVNPDPDVQELAEIAIASAQTARAIAGIEPKVAMLSFSTKGSAKHEKVNKMVEATALARRLDPELVIDGEMQADAALIASVGRKKAPGSGVAGQANVLVFPSVESGNIAYKLVQRLAGATAIGPILQGMAAPVNDLSRGCSVEDIINLVAITVNQANEMKKEKETIFNKKTELTI